MQTDGEASFIPQIIMRYAVDETSWMVLRNSGMGNDPSTAFNKFAEHVMRDAQLSEFHRRHFPPPHLAHEGDVIMPSRNMGTRLASRRT